MNVQAAGGPKIKHERHDLSIAVGVATRGRPAVLRASLDMIERQTRAADHVIVAAASSADAVGLEKLSLSHALILAQPGLTKQRNAVLEAAAHFDVVVFFDDDFLPSATYLAELEALLTAHSDVVLATGHVIADGIGGPGFSVIEGVRRLEGDVAQERPIAPFEYPYNVYGCNFAVRMSVVSASGAAFDENLPLYGWLEDVDFSRRLASKGRIVKSQSLRGVHLGVKSGRQPGILLGYSQIANPLYLLGKGHFTLRRAVSQMIRNLAMNLWKSFSPEPYVDRRGRLQGNIKAIGELARGRLDPRRILSL